MHLRIPRIAAALAVSTMLGSVTIHAQEGNKGEAAPPSLTSVKFQFEVAAARLRKPLADLDKQYAASLKALEEKVQKAGNLEQTLAVKQELEGFAEGKTKPAEGFVELARLRQIYGEQSSKLRREQAEKMGPLLEAHRKGLEQLAVDLTRSKRLEEALTAKEEAARMAILIKEAKKADAIPAKNSSVADSTRAEDGGSLFFHGTGANSVPPNVATAHGVDDLISVRFRSGGNWVGLRRNGRLISNYPEGIIGIRRSVKRLMNGLCHTAVFVIDANDTVQLAGMYDNAGPEWEFSRSIQKELRGVVDVCGGAEHFLALRQDGTVVGWGPAYDAPGAEPVPSEATKDVRAISTYSRLCYAAKKDGTVLAWAVGAGLVEVPSGIRDVTALSAGSGHCLALTETGKVMAWGSNASAQCDIPDLPGKFTAIRAGTYSSAAQTEDGSWIAWGDKTRGIVDKINLLGPLIDLTFVTAPGSTPWGYVMWIKAEEG